MRESSRQREVSEGPRRKSVSESELLEARTMIAIALGQTALQGQIQKSD